MSAHTVVPMPDAHLLAGTRALLDFIETYDIPFPQAILPPTMPENPDSLLVSVAPDEYWAWVDALAIDSEENTPHPRRPGIVRTLFHGGTTLGLRVTVSVFRPVPTPSPFLSLVGA